MAAIPFGTPADDPRRCHGTPSPINPSVPCKVCKPCPLRTNPPGDNVQWVRPAAKHDGDRWGCVTRESIAVHAPTLRAASDDAKPLDVGPADGGQDALEPVPHSGGVTRAEA